MQTIYFEGGKLANNLTELINVLFTGDKIWGERKALKTYEDPEYKYLQCGKEANRSFADLLDICRTYFPETTEQQLMDTLKSVYNNPDAIGEYIRGFYCPNIERMVFQKISHKAGYFLNPPGMGTIYEDKYTFEYLNKMY